MDTTRTQLPVALPQQDEPTEMMDNASVDMVVASLIDQLKRENENIARLMERQRKLRQELLRAQEVSLTAMQRGNEGMAQ